MAGRSLGDVAVCPQCGDEVQLRETAAKYKGRGIWYWTECTCWAASIARAGGIVEAAQAREAGRFDQLADLAERQLDALGGMTLETFDASRFSGVYTPYHAVLQWFNSIRELPLAESYHTGPPAALYLYSSGKGRGKTHLGAGLLHKARAEGRSVAFLNEVEYIESYWAADFADRERMSSYPAERAWLTMLDDMGQREGRGSSLRDAWYDIIGPRWLRRRWLIITSNYTPNQLLDQKTISEASYSRLIQMTRGQIITFEAADYRLAGLSTP